MRLAIVGGRDFNDYNMLVETIRLFNKHPQDFPGTVVSGGAQGADSLGMQYANCKGIPIRRFLPEWDKYGKSAGFIRNQTIVDNCDMVLAFWDGKSRGTADTIEKAKRAMKPTFIVYY